MARLNRKERAVLRAATDHLVAYADELREKSVGMDDDELRATQMEDEADGIEEVAADIDEMLYQAK